MKIMKVTALTFLVCATNANANADSKFKSMLSDSFITLKLGVAQQNKLGGNSGLDAGDPTFVGGMLVGKQVTDRFGVDLEWINKAKSSLSSNGSGTPTPYDTSNNWAVSSNTFMANITANLLQDSMAKPYVRLGLGISKNKSYDYKTINNEGLSTTYSGRTINSFAWQAGAGVSFNTHKMFDTQLEYMFINRGKFKTYDNYIDATGEVENAPAIYGTSREHVFTVGLKFKF